MSDRQRRPDRAKSAWHDSIEQEIAELEQSFRAIWEQEKTPRDRAAGVLQRAIEHFDFLGVSRDALAPLVEIQVAFEECERGLLHPLFQPDAKSGRPRRPWALLQQQGCAALAMEALIRAGVGPEEAAKKVARVLTRIGYKFPPNSKDEGETVAEMRYEIRRSLARKGQKFGFHAECEFDWLWLDQEVSKGRDPAELAKEVLGWLSAIRP